MRVRSAIRGGVILGLVSLAGCGQRAAAPPTPPRAVSAEGDLRTVLEADCSYVTACRTIVWELRKDLGDCVQHEVWPDIEQAGVRVQAPARGGLVVFVTIAATGPDRCRAEIFLDSYWRGRAFPAIQRALAAPPVPAKR